MSALLMLAWAGTIVGAFIGGFGCCLMLFHRDRVAPE